jgi:4-hydroxybenzoyl-CoA reductase subunit alpha
MTKNETTTASHLNVVGKPFRKVDARAKCTRPDEVCRRHRAAAHALLQNSAQHVPHALIKSIDVSKALRASRRVCIITGKDLPISYGILPVSQDEHALCIDKVRFIGDPVAAVAAIDEDVAFDAMN